MKGFEILPRRWAVERTSARPGRCRRLAKGWEKIRRFVNRRGFDRLNLHAHTTGREAFSVLKNFRIRHQEAT
ncbi:hypothetical protein AA23498_0823 [Acetobacter nitrogenifigens DSM 23921 = NBRC 105050]|nr:hypothetical protein AA23498_0823 [Acetobacter nitrogenifigens DSM 23921 = NBRC 105050]